jgi:NAD(P)H dehydrogenase (quinone)
MSSTLLVTGAAGHLGRRVIAHLLESRHVSPGRIVAATRNPEKLADLAARGIEIRRLDFDDPGTLGPALAGVDRMLLISTDALDRPGRRLKQHQAAVEAARRAGVKHVVYTSMPNPESSVVLFAPDHLGTEQALAASGLGWTILRNNWYMENLFMALPAALASGQWHTAAADGRVGYVAREDCARVAAAVLAAGAAEDAAGERYDVTGPESFTVEQVAAAVREITGRPLAVVPVSDEQLQQGLLAAGVPEFLAPLLVSFDANIRAGKLAVVSATVTGLTGKPPQTLRAFLEEHKAALAGS